MDVNLPNFFSFKTARDLVRIGRSNDGGYLISYADIQETDVLLSLGINDDWSFEKAFHEQRPVKILAYDASISAKLFAKEFLKALIRPYRLNDIFSRFSVWSGYNRFFGQKDVEHISKFVGFDSTDGSFISLENVLLKVKNSKVFLKVDIEGSEYRLLSTILENQECLQGLIIEFHDVDLNLEKIAAFINALDLDIAHIHVNNYAPVRSIDSLPLVLEITFSRHAEFENRTRLPHQLDMPNCSLVPEFNIKIETK